MTVATMRCFGELPQDDSQEQGLLANTPSQLFPDTPESFPMEGISQVSQGSGGLSQPSQGSIHEPAYVYPSTPDSFEGGSQSSSFKLVPGEVSFVHATSSSDPPSIIPGWSVHSLLKPAKAMAVASSSDNSCIGRKEKRGTQAAVQTSSEKRPRATSSAVIAIEEVSEEDRERRLQRRWNGVNAVRNSADFKFLQELFDQGTLPSPPPPPKYEPADETVSKRTWEKGMERWRHEVRALAFMCGFQTPSVPG